MTDKHTENSPAELDETDATSGQKSAKFWYMFVISTALIVTAMIIIFGYVMR